MSTGPASPFRPESIQSDLELKAFLEFRDRGDVSLKYKILLGLKSLFTDIPYAVLMHWPGPIGMQLRQIFFRMRLGAVGKNVLFGTGVEITGPRGISISDYVFIDHGVVLNAMAGRISVGRRIHVGPYASISGTASEVVLGDFAALGAFARIYAHSETPRDGKRLSGPMIPEHMKGMITAPVLVGKDAMIGTGAVVLPGAIIGEGAVVGANSLVPARMKIPPYAIFAGVPARLTGLRERVTVPDI